MNEFAQNLAAALQSELHYWKRRLKFETIHALDMRCNPCYGELNLSFLTDREDFDLSQAYSDEFYSKWRLGDLPYNGVKIEMVREWMRAEFEKLEKIGASLQPLETFLLACETALKSKKVKNMLRKYNLSPDFQITLFSPNSSFPRKNFYSISTG